MVGRPHHNESLKNKFSKVNQNYNYIKRKYNNKAKLLFRFTDSLTYEIETEDVYKDFSADKNKFDNNEYAENSSFFD